MQPNQIMRYIMSVWSLPVMLHNNLNVGVESPPLSYWFSMPFWDAFGSGIVRVIGLWNLRRRGSTVTIGLTATRLPSSFDTTSGWMGCACERQMYRQVSSEVHQWILLHSYTCLTKPFCGHTALKCNHRINHNLHSVCVYARAYVHACPLAYVCECEHVCLCDNWLRNMPQT